MRLSWRGNQHYNEDVSASTIMELNKPFKMSIQKYVGCGDRLYFTCPELGFSQKDLQTEDWDKAEEFAVQLMMEKAESIYERVKEML
jgi:hypothetical protein